MNVPPPPPPGWYPDPQGTGQRWWDGQQWTAVTDTSAQPQPEPARAGATTAPHPAFWVGITGAVAMIIGSLGPWATTVFATAPGTRGDGKWVIGLALSGCLGLVGSQSWRWRYGYTTAIVAGVIAALIGVVDAVNVSSQTTKLFGQDVNVVSVGWGLYLTIVASMVLAFAGAFLQRYYTRR